MANNQSFFFVEITDIFGGERNYSWVKRYKVRAKKPRGAVCKVSRENGLSFRNSSDGEYLSKSGATGLIIEKWQDEEHLTHTDI